MKYSMVVFTYNRPKSLKRCLLSLINQNYPKDKFEIIVIDDGSSLPVKEFIKELLNEYENIKYFYQDHKGVSAARNLGIKYSKGERIALIADDYQLSNKYLLEVDGFFKEHPKEQVISFNIQTHGNGIFDSLQQFYLQLTFLIKLKMDMIGKELVHSYGNLPASRGAVFKRDIFNKIGYFNEDLKGGEDTELAQRMGEAGIPIYMFFNKHIDHFEDKNIIKLLMQRMRYGFHGGIKTAKTRKVKRSISFHKTIKQFHATLMNFHSVSKKINKRAKYTRLFPLLAIFTFSFYFGAYIGFKSAERNINVSKVN